jgi:S-DNA-T family DNA segregation ATPase FtsK/SpoIIIE
MDILPWLSDPTEGPPETVALGAVAVIEATLADLKVPASVASSTTGPRFTRHVLIPDRGIRVSRLARVSGDLALALDVPSVRMDGNALEVPRLDPEAVPLAGVMREAAWPDSPIAFAIGRDVSGAPIVADLARMPHLLIAGATGTGKSVALNALLASMLARGGPDRFRLVMIDAKRVELAAYAGIAHLARPIATEVAEAEASLAYLLGIMESRYELLQRHGARSVGDLVRPVPRYVVVVDELADLVMSSKTIGESLVRLAQKSRAAGIHLVLATQRPSTDVISGLLKANVPARIALAVASNVDSRVILDEAGAEDLLGRGDMLYKPPWLLEPVRVQGAMVTDAEIAAIVARWPVTEAPASEDAPSAPTMRPEMPRAILQAVLFLACLAGLLLMLDAMR